MLRVSVPINLDCEHLVLSFWMVGVGEMTNLYNHQANRRVSAAPMAFAPDEAHSLNRGGRNGHNPINVQ